MLQKFNEKIKGIIAWIIVGLIAFTFALFGIDYYLQSQNTTNKVKLTVGDTAITAQEFELNYRRARQTNEGATLNANAEKALQNEVLQGLILQSISLKAAKKAGYSVSNDQASNVIRNIPQFQEEGRFSVNRYQQILVNNYFTAQTFQDEVRLGMLINQQKFSFMGTAFVLFDELEQYIKLAMQTRDYQYLSISPKPFQSAITISPESINNYYENNKAEFIADDEVSIAYVRLSMQDIKNKIKVSDAQIKEYYEENQMQKEKFATVKEQIKEQIISDAAQAQYSKEVDKLSDVSYQNTDSLEPVGEALNLKVETTKPFSMNKGNNDDISNNRAVREAAFSHDVLVLGNNSEPIQIDNDSVAVIRVAKSTPKRQKDLNEVKNIIEGKLIKLAAEEKAEAIGKSLLSADAIQAQKIINKNNLKWQKATDVTRNSLKVDAAVNKLAFNIAKSNKKIGSKANSGDYLLVQLQNIHDGSINLLTPEQTSNLIKQLEANFGTVDYDLFINYLREKTEVVNKS